MDTKSPYLHPRYETLSREELAGLQTQRLQETIKRCQRVPFYAKRLQEIGRAHV